MEQKLWMLTLFLILLNRQLHISQDLIKGNGILETQGCNCMQIIITHPPMQVTENYFPLRYCKDPTPLAMEKDHAFLQQHYVNYYKQGKSIWLLEGSRREF